jgi:CheY-like chemotaxis protein
MKYMHYVLAVGDDEDIAFLDKAFNAQPGRIPVTSMNKGLNLWNFISGRLPAEFPILIIIDQHLSDVDSLALLLRIKADKQLRLIPVAMMSGFTSQELIHEYYRAGANCFYRKPLDPNDWHHMVECLLTLFNTRY